MEQSWKRPKLKIQKRKSERVWDIIGFSFYIGSIIFVFVFWRRIPEIIPAHYNASGEIDRWGSKWELFIFPLIGGVTCLFMQLFEKYPEWYNYPKRFNESNAEQFYLNGRKMVNQLKNIWLIFFSILLLEAVFLSLGINFVIGQWLLPLLIISTAIPIIWGIIQQRKIQ